MARIAFSAGTKPIVAASNFMVWASSAIVAGITGYFLNNYAHDQHLIYQVTIVSFDSPPPFLHKQS